MEMTPERWEYTGRYLRDVFGDQDAALEQLVADMREADLPDIAVSADVGRLLMILARLAPDPPPGAKRSKTAVEVGTLGGYSTVWLARGLGLDTRVITIEKEAKHADFATRQFERLQLADQIELRRGAALDILPALSDELGERSIELVFIDALKTEYPAYWEIIRPMIVPGGIVVADNALGSGSWWIDDETNESRVAADRFNRLVSGDPDFEAVALPIREGVLIAHRAR